MPILERLATRRGGVDAVVRGRLVPILAPVLGFLTLLLCACAPEQDGASDVSVTLESVPAPLAVGPAVLEIALASAEGEPLSGVRVELEGNMNHAGMVPVFAEASEAAPGTYRGELELTMGGDWFVIVRGELPDGRTLERSLELPPVSGAACCTDGTEAP